jgi:stearoyl-CoA desaturase (Delta-9 desaturase)
MAVQLRERPAATTTRGVVRLDAKQLRAQRRITLTLTVLPPAAVAVAIYWFWGHAISGRDLGIMLFFYSITCIGITVGFHRLFTHRSFKALRPVRIALAIYGSMAVQGSVISWVATHRRHHAYADDFGDPHSPHLAQASGLRGVLLGLYHAHVGWLFDSERSDNSEWAPDLVADPAMVKVDRSFGWLTLATFLLPGVAGGLISMSWGGILSGLLWGGVVRIFLLHHMTWSINSICHFYGKEAYQARDESRNVWPLALSSFGESWHNNHHAFPWSARLGLRAWQIDPGWYVIRLLKAFRVIGSVKVPSKEQIIAKLKPIPSRAPNPAPR